MDLGQQPTAHQRNKRKPVLSVQIPSRPGQMTKRILQREARSADNQTGPVAHIQLDPTGFYEVRVEQNHGQAIADKCGVTTEDVFLSLEQDNQERRLASIDAPPALTQTELDEINRRFDPDTDDELCSEED